MNRVYDVTVLRGDGGMTEHLNFAASEVGEILGEALASDDLSVLEVKIRRVLPSAPYAPGPAMGRALVRWMQ